METLINILVLVFTASVAFIVEKIMYRHAPSQQKIADYQIELDKMDANAKIKWDLDWNHDSLTEIIKSREFIKSMVPIFSGVFLAFVFLLTIVTTRLSDANYFLMCVSALILICYGLIRMAESKKLAIGLLAFILVSGTLVDIAFDKLMVWNPYTYFYLCGLIAVIAIFILGRSSVKKKSV